MQCHKYQTSIGWTITTSPKPPVSPTSTSKATSSPTPTPIPSAKTAKATLDTWYKNNILNTEYEKHISDNIFCNDRVETSKEESIYIQAAGGTIKVPNYYYGEANKNFTCPQKTYAYTKNDTTKGNGSFTYPIGLITRNEVTAAGKGNTTNNNFYLYKGTSYWTFSPYAYKIVSAGGSSVEYTHVTTAPDNSNNMVHYDYNGGLVPVINIKPESLSKLKGEGTKSNPWTLN